MANNRNTYQQVHNVSINREKLSEIAADDSLSKKDLRVLIALFTTLDGYSLPLNMDRQKDPLNFKKIDRKKIAKLLDLDKSDVDKSIDNLNINGYIEEGSNDTIKHGWRFTF